MNVFSFPLVNPKAFGWGRRTAAPPAGGGSGPTGSTALARIQSEYQAGNFAAYWGIQDELTYVSAPTLVTSPSTSGGVALMPDKAAFEGDETVSEYASRLGLTGTALSELPGFPGYQPGSSYEPNNTGSDSATNPIHLDQNNSDEALYIQSSKGFATGSTSHTMVVAIRTTDTDFVMCADDGQTTYVGRVRNTGGTADQGAGSNVFYRVDGVDVVGTIGSALFATGVSDGNWHVLTATGIDFSSFVSNLIIMGYQTAGSTSNLNFNGDLAYMAIFPDDATTLQLAEQDAASACVSINHFGYYHYDFRAVNPAWFNRSGFAMTFGSVNSTAGESASFFAGSSTGQSGSVDRTVEVTAGEDYTFKVRKHRTGGGGNFQVFDTAGGAALATIDAAEGTDEVTFTAPASGSVDLVMNAIWDFYMYVDEIALFPASSTAPF